MQTIQRQVIMAEFRCGECAVCDPELCRICPGCSNNKGFDYCEAIREARSKQCLKHDELKAAHDAAVKDRTGRADPAARAELMMGRRFRYMV